MTTELQVRALLRAAEREERVARAALVIAEDTLNRLANEHASRCDRYLKTDDALDQWRAQRVVWRDALRRWRLAKDAREVAQARRAS